MAVLEEGRLHVSDATESIRAWVEEAGHLLPEQAPLHLFVHHNTLHAFEHLPFEEGVVEAARVFDAEPFQSEEAFRRCLESGRIRAADVEAVLDEEPADDERPLFPGGPTRRRFRGERLRHLFEVPRGAAVTWLLRETDALRRLHASVSPARRAELVGSDGSNGAGRSAARIEERVVAELWTRLASVVLPGSAAEPRRRRRDQILRVARVDTDRWVHTLLIRLAAAFLDQGIAYWSMPARDEGFLVAFRTLYSLPLGPADRWLGGLRLELARQAHLGWDGERTIAWALAELGVPPAEQRAVIHDTLQSLRGWAGMMRQFELHPERAGVEPRPARLIDYLAVQLVLDVFAVRFALREHLDRASYADLERAARRDTGRETGLGDELAYEAFVTAQVASVDPLAFADPSCATAWLAEVRAFHSVERRRILHLAYERRHRLGVLDGVAAHCRAPVAQRAATAFQAVFCIDDREESLRRHVEELCPDAETFGYAGFYGVVMAYQGLDDVHPRPLCPVNLTPRHLVVERALDPGQESDYRRTRRRQGAAEQALFVGGKTLVRGSLLSTVLGLASVVPLIGRCLSPRLFERWSRRLRNDDARRPATRLALDRSAGDEPYSRFHGFTAEEMIGVAEAALKTMGLDRELAPVVLVVGHGSSSLNNPHEAAYDCGATGGGRGGPNARAFAAMVNRAAVRAGIAERGVDVPERTWFVGAYHNTCDDSLIYYDEDQVPERFGPELARAKLVLAEACKRNAHERCRRFETVPLSIDLDAALERVRSHAVDLGQPRPERGHATNAVCIVGRRRRTRGLFLDRRAFLVSYDPSRDPEGAVLWGLLAAIGPVCAGISLEYYFSFVDSPGYGCGTKLPHNVVGLFGVMDGHASDLRTGLPWQMVDIHEPVRLLTIVEAPPERLLEILATNPVLSRLIRNEWIQLVALSPDSDAMHVYRRGAFRPYVPESTTLPVAASSRQVYAGSREPIGCTRVSGGER